MADPAPAPTPDAPADDVAQFQGLFDAGAFDESPREPQPAATSPAPAQERDPAHATGGEPGGPGDGQQAQGADDTDRTVDDDGAPEADGAIQTLAEFLQENELDPEQFNALRVGVKVNGEESEVPLSDLVKSYQLERNVNQKSIEVSNLRKEIEAERAVHLAQHQQLIERNEALGQLALSELTRDFQATNWQELRASDPAEFAARNQEYAQRHQAVQGFLAEVAQQKQQQAARDAEAQQQRIAEEKNRMFEAIPDWRDASKFAKDREQILQYGKEIGLTDAELNAVIDHRHVQILRDAARYRALQAAQPAMRKRVSEAPRLRLSGGTRVNRDPARVALEGAKQRVAANPRDADAQAALFGAIDAASG